MRLNPGLVYIGCLFVIYVTGYIGLIVVHEQVHVTINEHYGIESEVDYWYGGFWNAHAVTIGDKTCPTDSCTLAHNMNEIVGYPIGILWAFGGCFFMFMEVRRVWD